MIDKLTSREVIGVLKVDTGPRAKLVLEYIERLHKALDEKCDYNDMLGTEGWRHFLLEEDE